MSRGGWSSSSAVGNSPFMPSGGGGGGGAYDYGSLRGGGSGGGSRWSVNSGSGIFDTIRTHLQLDAWVSPDGRMRMESHGHEDAHWAVRLGSWLIRRIGLFTSVSVLIVMASFMGSVVSNPVFWLWCALALWFSMEEVGDGRHVIGIRVLHGIVWTCSHLVVVLCIVLLVSQSTPGGSIDVRVVNRTHSQTETETRPLAMSCWFNIFVPSVLVVADLVLNRPQYKAVHSLTRSWASAMWAAWMLLSPILVFGVWFSVETTAHVFGLAFGVVEWVVLPLVDVVVWLLLVWMVWKGEY